MTSEEKITAKLDGFDVTIQKMLKNEQDPGSFLLEQYEKQFDLLPMEAAENYRTKWILYCMEVSVMKNKNEKAPLENKVIKVNIQKVNLLKQQVGKHNGNIESFYLFWAKYEKHILNRDDIDDNEKQIILCDRLSEKDQNNLVNLNFEDTKAYLFKNYRSSNDIRSYIREIFSNMDYRNDIDGLQKITEALQSAIHLAKTADSGAPELLIWLFRLVYKRIEKELRLKFWNDSPDKIKNCPENLFEFLEKQRDNLKADRDALMPDDGWKKPNHHHQPPTTTKLDETSKKQTKPKSEANEQRHMSERNSTIKDNNKVVNSLVNVITALTGKFTELNKSQTSTENLFGDKWNIDFKDLTIHHDEQLGAGSYGQVFKGTLMRDSESILVAVKKRLPKMTNEQMIEEAQKMKGFDHPNVLKMYGVCKIDKNVHLVMEIMTGNNLHLYLKSTQLQKINLIEIVQQILEGLIYLEEKNYIHRDIASRNILVNELGSVKIADFGLTRLLAKDGAHARNGHSKTLRNYTIAPEAYEFQKYTIKSDVWSLGIVLWEIFAGGNVPFESWKNELKNLKPKKQMEKFMNQVKSGRRLDCPKHKKICAKCPLYSILTDCWNLEPNKRPNYSEIKTLVSFVQRFT